MGGECGGGGGGGGEGETQLAAASVGPVPLCRYLLSIITTHIKKTRPELETVLLKVKQLKGRILPPS